MPGEALETSEAVERAVLWVDGLGARKLSRLEGNLIHGGRTEPVLACVSAVIGSHRFPPSSTGIRSGLRMPMELDRYAIGMARLANAMIAFGDARERPSVHGRDGTKLHPKVTALEFGNQLCGNDTHLLHARVQLKREVYWCSRTGKSLPCTSRAEIDCLSQPPRGSPRCFERFGFGAASAGWDREITD